VDVLLLSALLTSGQIRATPSFSLFYLPVKTGTILPILFGLFGLFSPLFYPDPLS